MGVLGISDSVFSIRFSIGKYSIQKIEHEKAMQTSLNSDHYHYFILDEKYQGSFTVTAKITKGTTAADMLIFLKEIKNKNYEDILHNPIDEKDSD